MYTNFKGGRGKTAPYTTKMERVPVPLAPQVKELVSLYRQYIEAEGNAASPPNFIEQERQWRTESVAANQKLQLELEQLRSELAAVREERDQLDRKINLLHKE